MKLKSIRFSKDGYGKVNLRELKKILEGGDLDEWIWKEKAKEIADQIDAEIIEKEKRKKFKETLEEFSTKIGEDE